EGLIHLWMQRIWKDSHHKQLRRKDRFFVLSLWFRSLSQRERARVRGFFWTRGPSPQPSPSGRGRADRPFAGPHSLHGRRTPTIDVDGDAREIAGPFRGQERDHVAGFMGFAEPA